MQPAAKGLAGQRRRTSLTYCKSLILVADLRDGGGVKRAVLRNVLFGGRETAIM